MSKGTYRASELEKDWVRLTLKMWTGEYMRGGKWRKSSGDVERSGTYPAIKGRIILSSFREWGACPIVTFSSLERMDSVGQGPFVWELENSDWSPSDLQDLLGLHEWNESVGLDQCFLTFFIMETPFKQQQKIETAPSPSTVHVTVAVTVIVSMNSVVPLEAFVFHSWKFCTYDKNTFTGKPFVSVGGVFGVRLELQATCPHPWVSHRSWLSEKHWPGSLHLRSVLLIALSQDKIPGLVSLFLSANWRSFVEEVNHF